MLDTCSCANVGNQTDIFHIETILRESTQTNQSKQFTIQRKSDMRKLSIFYYDVNDVKNFWRSCRSKCLQPLSRNPLCFSSEKWPRERVDVLVVVQNMN